MFYLKQWESLEKYDSMEIHQKIAAPSLMCNINTEK